MLCSFISNYICRSTLRVITANFCQLPSQTQTLHENKGKCCKLAGNEYISRTHFENVTLPPEFDFPVLLHVTSLNLKHSAVIYLQVWSTISVHFVLCSLKGVIWVDLLPWQRTVQHRSLFKLILPVFSNLLIQDLEFHTNSRHRTGMFHPGPVRKLSTNLYDIYHCWVYSE
jgi:hypothetical protein